MGAGCQEGVGNVFLCFLSFTFFRSYPGGIYLQARLYLPTRHRVRRGADARSTRRRICSLPPHRSTNQCNFCLTSYNQTADHVALSVWTFVHNRSDTGTRGGAESVKSGEIGEIAVKQLLQTYICTGNTAMYKIIEPDACEVIIYHEFPVGTHCVVL